ncbi:hypothetical protein BDZ45DRAFT_790581 [Acephala macrosclerotiorum]|nr:hypothetical protein BDZ45DRAFT_790581 [Acephala macrosclerotiorum]
MAIFTIAQSFSPTQSVTILPSLQITVDKVPPQPTVFVFATNTAEFVALQSLYQEYSSLATPLYSKLSHVEAVESTATPDAAYDFAILALGNEIDYLQFSEKIVASAIVDQVSNGVTDFSPTPTIPTTTTDWDSWSTIDGVRWSELGFIYAGRTSAQDSLAGISI